MVNKIIFGLLLVAQAGALWNVGGGPLLAHLILTGCVFLMLGAALIKSRSLSVGHRWLFGIYGVFCVLYVASVLLGIVPQYGFSEILLFINSGMLMALFAGLETTEKELRWLLYGIIALGVIESIAGFYFYVRSPLPRMVGTFGDVNEPNTAAFNAYANYLLLVLPVALWHFFRKHARVATTLLAGLCASIIFTAFILTFSRAAWLSFVGVMVLWGLWSVIGRPLQWSIYKKKIALSLALILGVVVMLGAVQYGRSVLFDATSLKDKALFQADEGSSSATERLDYWHAALRIMGDRPVLGGGVLAFHYLYPPLQSKFGINEDHPHNFFLKIGVENGVPAMALITIFLIGALIYSVKFFWKGNRTHVGIALLLGTLGALAHNLLDYNFIASNFVLFAVWIGVCLNFSKSSSVKIKRISLVPLFIVSVILCLIGLHEAYYHRYFKAGRALLAEKKTEEALVNFQKAKPLFFPRDLVFYLPDAEPQNNFDPEMQARAGEALVKKGDYAGALVYFDRALQLDPTNTMKYYFLKAQALLAQDQHNPNAKEFIQSIDVLLDQYALILARNEHFAILTQNPGYASKLYELLEQFGVSGAAEKRKTFDALWFNQMLLYSQKFGSKGLEGSVVPR